MTVKHQLKPRVVCGLCGYRCVPGEGYCWRCCTANPPLEVKEDEDGDRDA